jgi:hypothetical protein
MALRSFNIPQTDTASFFASMDSSEPCVKTALVAVEGTFDDSDGVPFTFDSKRLNTIADFTNAALSKGITIPVCTDHQVKFDTTVGSIEGSAFTKVITEDDLPNKRATDLLGRVGLFVSNVVIKTPKAIEQVLSNVVRNVSMGLNLDANDHRIMELSLVPIPAIPNMGLFKKGRGNFNFVPSIGNESTAFTWDELEINQRQLDDLKEEFDSLVQSLWGLLNNIYTSDTQDISDIDMLKQYVYAALNGFSIRTVDLLGLSDEAGGTDPAADASAMTARQQMDYQQMRRDDMAPQDTGFARKYTIGRFSTGLLARPIYQKLPCS